MRLTFRSRALIGGLVALAVLTISAAPAGAAIVNITVGPGAVFVPTPAMANVGDTVRWTFAGSHSTTFGPSGVMNACGNAGGVCGTCGAGACGDTWNSGFLNAADTYDHTFSNVMTSTGTYNYVCYPHYPNHNGQLIVQAGTAVAFMSFTAARSSRGVLLRWKTASETGFLGFYVYRSLKGRMTKVNRTLIPAIGTFAGAAYRFLDKSARRDRTYTYRLQAVNVDGSKDWYGRVTVRAR